MSEKSLSKDIIASYTSSVIPVCKLLKSHATNIMLLPERKVLMQPIISGIRNYMIVDPKVDYSRFVYTYFSLAEISKVNTAFKKTKSEIDWYLDNGTNYLGITNPEQDTYKTPIINNHSALADLLDGTYSSIPEWEITSYEKILQDESTDSYNMLPDEFIGDMNDKKLCELTACGNTVLISRPFLGDLKKTKSVGYKLIDVDETKMVLKFRQSEELGNIYTYAAFLLI